MTNQTALPIYEDAPQGEVQPRGESWETCPMLEEIQLRYKTKTPASERVKISSSDAARDYLMKVWDHDTIELRESFYAIFLNSAMRVLGWIKIGDGGISGVVADKKLILATGLKSGASSFMVAHNHPSGSLKPSESDFKITGELKKCGEVLDLELVDHLIVTTTGYYSFADNHTLDGKR